MAHENGSFDERPGKLRYGFNIVARDLDRAFAVGSFEPLQVLLIEQARELSYAVAKLANLDDPAPFKINISALARATGRSRHRLSQRFNELVVCRVFLVLEDGSFLINKDFRQWTDIWGRARLTEVQTRWCIAIRRDKPVMPNCARPGTGADDAPVPDQAHPLCPTRHTPCARPGTPRTCLPPDPPVEERAQRVNSRVEEREEKTPLSPPRGGASSRRESSSERNARKRREMLDAIKAECDANLKLEAEARNAHH